jgi:IPT/TIG domain
VTETAPVAANITAKPQSTRLVLASSNSPNYKFTDSYTEFKTYRQPIVKKIFPNIGLTEGGTAIELSGAWFDQQLEFDLMPYCKIGQKVVRGQFISSVRIVCVTPPNDNIIQQQPVYVSLNGINWVDTGFFFSYYVQPVLLGITPKYGQMQGGTEIFIQGQRFSNITDPEFVKCKFTLIGNGRETAPKFIPAIYRDEQTMMCVSPNGFFGGEAVNV